MTVSSDPTVAQEPVQGFRLAIAGARVRETRIGMLLEHLDDTVPARVQSRVSEIRTGHFVTQRPTRYYHLLTGSDHEHLR